MVTNRTRRKPCLVISAMLLILLTNSYASASTPDPQDPQPAAPQARSTEVTIYPLLLQSPLFGAEIDIPDLPGSGGSGASGSTDVSLNGAYMFGVTVESRRWLVDANGLWAALDADHPRPLITVDTDTWFFNVMAGSRIAGGLFAVGGVRGVSTDIDVTLTAPSQTSTLNGRTGPSFLDPMIGVAYRGRLGSRTTLDAEFKGGGFGVGTDVDVSAEAAIDWNIAGRFVLRAGYSLLYYKWTSDAEINAIQRPLESRQTLHGPEIGFGIRF